LLLNKLDYLLIRYFKNWARWF